MSISGILICASAQKTGLTAYVIGRVSRIFPALLFMVVVYTGIIIPFMFGQNLLNSEELRNYFVANLTLIKNQHEVSGVFINNPNRSLNGVLWSILLEARLYFFVGILLCLGVLKLKPHLSTSLLLLVGLLLYFAPQLVPLIGEEPRIYGMRKHADFSMIFIIGMVFFLNVDRNDGSEKIMVIDTKFVGVALLCVLIFWGPLDDHSRRIFTFALAIGAAVLLASHPAVVRWRLSSDFSYGVYLWGWPMQQILKHYIPSISPIQNFVFASMFALVFAFISWNLVEKPSLIYGSKLKEYLNERLYKLR